jgi:hypothetical protein
MPTGLTAWIIYAIGGAVFAGIVYAILRLIGLGSHPSFWISLPVGILGFLIFIFLNRDGDFGVWESGRRNDDDADIDFG